jgi:D-alanyl-D-alanine carboxypeptidase (penicillin-binding protein 5/6)
LQTRVERTDPLIAPLARGQRVGTIKVTTGAGAPVIDVPLVALEAVPPGSLPSRIWDSLRLWIK